MTTPDAPRHRWPEAEPISSLPTAKQGRLARLGRALADIFLTIGLSQGLRGRSGDGSRAATNVILFGEGEAIGRDANRGSDHK